MRHYFNVEYVSVNWPETWNFQFFLDRTGDGYTYTDDEEEFTSNDEGSDSEPMMDDTLGMATALPRKPGSRKLLPPAARVRNLIIAFNILIK